MVIDKHCSAAFTNDDGQELKCHRKNFWDEKNQKFWEHSGGHMYMTDQNAEILKFKIDNGWHFDNTALLSLQPADSHAPEDCDGTGFCSWRIKGIDR